MSDLRIYVDNTETSVQLPAPASCESQPPPAGRRDTCSITVPLTLDVPNPPPVHQITFDRQGDQFVLSPSNSAENLTWVSSQGNLQGVRDILHMTGSLIRYAGRNAATDRYSVGFYLWIGRYLGTGLVQQDNNHPRIAELDMTSILLEYFSFQRSRDLAPMIGAINLFRREPGLSEDVRQRISEVTSLLDLAAPFHTFTSHFITEQDAANLNHLSNQAYERYARLWSFLRRSFVAISQNRPLSYDTHALEAVNAYQEMFGSEIRPGQRPTLCAALEAAVAERAGSQEAATRLMGECQEGFALAARPAEEALRESLRRSLVNPAGLAQLQSVIASESSAANMRIDWLHGRGAFGQVFASVLENIQVNPSAGTEAAPTLSFNVAAFQQRFRLMASLTDRGEYDLSALALMRRLFGTEGAPPPIRVFANGRFQEVSWVISEENLRQLRSLISFASTRRQSSASFANTGMPIVFGSTCVLGAGGLVLSQTLQPITSNRGLQLGLGTTSAGLTGAGCLGFAGHYFWPAVVPRSVHNRYAWDLGSSAVGSGIGIATYLLINLLSGGHPMPDNPAMRNPVDPFGP